MLEELFDVNIPKEKLFVILCSLRIPVIQGVDEGPGYLLKGTI